MLCPAASQALSEEPEHLHCSWWALWLGDEESRHLCAQEMRVPFPGGGGTDRAKYGREHLVMLYRDKHSSVGLIFISSLDALLLPGSSHHSPSPPSMDPPLSLSPSLPDPSSHSLEKQQLQGHALLSWILGKWGGRAPPPSPCPAKHRTRALWARQGSPAAPGAAGLYHAMKLSPRNV